MNNLDPEVAEHPEDLVVYGGTGKAARNWPAYDALVRTPARPRADDETLLVQSGKPVGVMRTHEWAPRVLIANSNLVGDWANWEEFRRLEELGLTMYGQMTAGSWIYIGTQGILQGTYETFAAVAAKRFGGTLAGTITLTAGLGGMGGAQPLAVTMNDGVAICIESTSRGSRAASSTATSTSRPTRSRTPSRVAVAARDAAPPAVDRPARQRRRAGAAAARDERADRHRHRPDLRARPAVLPADRRRLRGLARRARARDPAGFTKEAAGLDGRARAGDGRLPGRGRRGLRLRQLDPRRGAQGRLRPGLRLPRLRAGVHPAAVLRGQGPVPLGRAVRRPGRHRRDRPGDPRAVPRQRAAAQVDHHGAASGCTSRACRRGSAGSGTASATWPG